MAEFAVQLKIYKDAVNELQQNMKEWTYVDGHW